MADDTVIQSLEMRLKQQNKGQGLGFKLRGTVINKALLGRVAITLGTTGSTILAYLLKLADDDMAAGSACTLTGTEAAGLQEIMRNFSNRTCTYGGVQLDVVLATVLAV
jgi:hypothetical protein